MSLLVYKPSAKVAHNILEFFEKNPDKNYCFVVVGDSKEVIYRRRDIPRLKELSKPKGG